MLTVNIPVFQDSAPAGNGAQGFQGSAGSQGAQGFQGAGSQGAQGDSGGSSADGWTAAGVTLTYASSTTFTAPGDLTTTYNKGVKIKLTQTTVKYFYVVNSSHAAGTTTVTVSAGSDYTLANAAITLPYVSRSSVADGFPTTFNYVPVFTGFSVAPSNLVATFFLIGRVCTTHIRTLTYGTSNANTMTVTAPLTSRTLTNAFWVSFGSGHDNGANLATPVRMSIDSNNTIIQLSPTPAGALGNWTSSGAKALVSGTIIFEI